MTVSIAHLGPSGTYAEAAALAYAQYLTKKTGEEAMLCPCSSISQTLWTVAKGDANIGVVPVENSIEGSVTMTLDTLWQIGSLQIQQALILPIAHALISQAENFANIQVVYSHPQALAQCQGWLEKHLSDVPLIAKNSTTEALQFVRDETHSAAIASLRAAELYQLPVLAHPINDYPDNCTRFWVVSLQPSGSGKYTSLGFSVPANVPGALAKPLAIFADRGINLSRIESRPSKRSLGDYLFFMDLEADSHESSVELALAELKTFTETLKVFGSYTLLNLD